MRAKLRDVCLQALVNSAQRLLYLPIAIGTLLPSALFIQELNPFRVLSISLCQTSGLLPRLFIFNPSGFDRLTSLTIKLTWFCRISRTPAKSIVSVLPIVNCPSLILWSLFTIDCCMTNPRSATHYSLLITRYMNSLISCISLFAILLAFVSKSLSA